MPNLDARIVTFVPGDSLTVRRTIDRTGGDDGTAMAAGAYVSKAWFTVKTLTSQGDGSAVFQKAISTNNVAGTGQIEENGQQAASNVNPIVRFDLVSTNTAAIGTTGRYYDIQIKLDDGTISTPESGQIRGRVAEITQSTT